MSFLAYALASPRLACFPSGRVFFDVRFSISTKYSHFISSICFSPGRLGVGYTYIGCLTSGFLSSRGFSVAHTYAGTIIIIHRRRLSTSSILCLPTHDFLSFSSRIHDICIRPLAPLFLSFWHSLLSPVAPCSLAFVFPFFSLEYFSPGSDFGSPFARTRFAKYGGVYTNRNQSASIDL